MTWVVIKPIRQMTDLKNPKLIYAKGFLFLLLGFMAAGWLVAESQSVRITLLMLISIWAFCRFYYFAFYVIQHYVDDGFRYSGLIDFARRTVLTKS